MAGVERARIDGRANRAVVVYDPARVTPEDMIEAVRTLDFEAVLAE